MSGQSLGLIETVGLTVAVAAADSAMKSANVELIGYELTKGDGLVTVKLAGEVGAMNAAVAAGVAAANQVGSVYAWKVIARTATGISSLITSTETYHVVPEPEDENCPSESECKGRAIPVIHIEPAAMTSGCIEMGNDIVAENMGNMPASTKVEVILPHAKSEIATKSSEVLAEEKGKGITQDDKKSLRTRTKNTRRS